MARWEIVHRRLRRKLDSSHSTGDGPSDSSLGHAGEAELQNAAPSYSASCCLWPCGAVHSVSTAASVADVTGLYHSRPTRQAIRRARRQAARYGWTTWQPLMSLVSRGEVVERWNCHDQRAGGRAR